MIVVVGEALVDLVGAPAPCDDEVDVPPVAARYEARPGGGPANAAVALARLGVPTALLARISRDRFGQLSRARLAAAGVDVRQVVDAGEPSALAVADAGPHGASYRFYLDHTDAFSWRPGELPDSLGGNVEAVHAGSLSLLRVPTVEALLHREAGRCVVVIDPNVRPAWAAADEYRAALVRWLEVADVVKVSVDDLAVLAPGADPIDAARSWLTARPALVVITLGAEGAVAVGRRSAVRRPAVPVEAADTVGAGDAFGAGLLAGLRERGLLRALQLAQLDGDALTAVLDVALGAAADAFRC